MFPYNFGVYLIRLFTFYCQLSVIWRCILHYKWRTCPYVKVLFRLTLPSVCLYSRAWILQIRCYFIYSVIYLLCSTQHTLQVNFLVQWKSKIYFLTELYVSCSVTVEFLNTAVRSITAVDISNEVHAKNKRMWENASVYEISPFNW